MRLGLPSSSANCTRFPALISLHIWCGRLLVRSVPSIDMIVICDQISRLLVRAIISVRVTVLQSNRLKFLAWNPKLISWSS
jgi:hypothetical protein